jgi:hypothetical protein
MCDPQTTTIGSVDARVDRVIAVALTNQLDPLTGLGSGEWYESRFLRKCIDGGHAGIGHRRRAVGNQDFLRRVNSRELASNKRPLIKKRLATMASLPRRRKPSVSIAEEFADIRPFQRIGVWLGIASGPRAASGFKSFMHFSYYLMIAALTLIGFEVIYALYQLASFVL